MRNACQTIWVVPRHSNGKHAPMPVSKRPNLAPNTAWHPNRPRNWLIYGHHSAAKMMKSSSRRENIGRHSSNQNNGPSPTVHHDCNQDDGLVSGIFRIRICGWRELMQSNRSSFDPHRSFSRSQGTTGPIKLQNNAHILNCVVLMIIHPGKGRDIG